jgi:hypothetical protein
MLCRQALSAALLALLLPAQASALSCLRPEIDALWTRATGGEARYTVALGRLDFDAGGLPQTGVGAAAQPVYLPARFTGNGLSQQGFDTPMSLNVALEVRCIGPWCGSATPGQELVAFLRQHPEGWVVELAPCGGMVWPEPDAAVRARLLACMNGADCRHGR